jgi:tetratricopeptide (TPR) repeat protein
MAAAVSKRRADECPDLETIAEFLDGRLPEESREVIADHISRCETCYFVFSEAAQMRPQARAKQERPQPKPLKFSWFTRSVAWSTGGLAAAAAASIMLMVATGVTPWRTTQSPELRALVAAVGSDRTIEARLTGGFAYGPLRGPVRSGEASSAKISPDVQIAAAEIEKAELGKSTAGARHLLGLAYLTSGDIDHAVPTLEQAAEQAADAQILSDLAAAYLVRAERLGGQQDLTKALNAADRAIHANPHLLEALFNRAYTLERLSLVPEARAAWQEYLKVDSNSGWAAEAQQHLRALQ